VSSATPALILAAAGVGFGHAIMPDHWVPLALVGRTRRYPLVRITRLSGLAGVAHVLVSLMLGAVIIAIGLQFRSAVQDAQDTIVGAVLIATGVAFAAVELTGRGHSHHRHPHDHGDRTHAHSHDTSDGHSNGGHARLRGVAGIMVPFGAAASPDLTILPVFLAATAAGAATAIGSLIAFAVVTIATIVGLTLLATIGGYQLKGRWLDRSANAITAAVLLLIGTLVLTGAI
jgi:nickel/cobalt transporter (NicO) family protein